MNPHHPPPPRLGPTPNTRHHTTNRPPHTPRRPLWTCRACAQPWPCPDARLHLTAEYHNRQPHLSIYLAGLYHLNPHDGPTPRQLFDRFIAWGPFRRTPREARE
ncbi:hypothetical protein [Salinispora sp. H7-4]|uniref:hypothetical protein n=1 Tax=Salinispora sp. H7-4 TaxID=2748321 RepID=UPI0015D32546|nr:hypothetical protein [Salinispora sp. H7-4]NYT96748.1 hypothetical protein [Salinispora sp. H7-4]